METSMWTRINQNIGSIAAVIAVATSVAGGYSAVKAYFATKEELQQFRCNANHNIALLNENQGIQQDTLEIMTKTSLMTALAGKNRRDPQISLLDREIEQHNRELIKARDKIIEFERLLKSGVCSQRDREIMT